MAGQRYEARFFDKTSWDGVTCRLCPHNCSIAPSRSGTCGVRTNRGGVLYLDLYGRVTQQEVVNSDDLPLYHYKPDAAWLLIGSKGCTMRCPFCNTYRQSQAGGSLAQPATPEELVAFAVERKLRGISFGVNEPAHMHEFVFDIFRLARAAGLATHIATGGMWTPDALRELLPYLSAATVGLKGFSNSFYQKELGGDLDTLRNNIALLLANGIHTELTWLVIPGQTTRQEDAHELLAFLRRQAATPPIILLPATPDYSWTKVFEPTTLRDLQNFHTAFKAYGGSVYEAMDESSEKNTRCTKCGRTLIRRGVARLVITSWETTGKPKDQCPSCGTAVPYVID